MKIASVQHYRRWTQLQLLRGIEQAIRHTAEGNRRISRQQEIIVSLERNGSNVAQALPLLNNLLFSQELHLRDHEYLYRLSLQCRA
jgi:hypothetical protein